MFYNIYRDLREKRPFPHLMLWSGYSDKARAINCARNGEKHFFDGILEYVKTVESNPPVDFNLCLSIRDKNQLWNQTLPEVHFYDAGRTQYR